MNMKSFFQSAVFSTAAMTALVLPTSAVAESESNFILAPDQDPELVQAQKEAQSKLDTFKTSFSEKSEDQSFMIKTNFVEDGQSEHMWLKVYKISGDEFFGVLDNQPRYMKKVKLGDKVTIKKSQVEDWMMLDKKTGDWQGGFTVKVLLKRQLESQQ